MFKWMQWMHLEKGVKLKSAYCRCVCVCVSVVFTLSAEEAKRQKHVAKMQFRDAFLFHWCKAFISILYPVQLLVLWGSENNCLRATSSKLWMHTDAGRGTNTMADKDSLWWRKDSYKWSWSPNVSFWTQFDLYESPSLLQVCWIVFSSRFLGKLFKWFWECMEMFVDTAVIDVWYVLRWRSANSLQAANWSYHHYDR